MVKFTVPAGHNAGACCQSEKGRYATSDAVVYRGAVQDEKGNANTYVVATDAKTLSILRVDAERPPEKPTLIPEKALAARTRNLTTEVNGEVRTTDGKKTTVMPAPVVEGRFPAFRDVFPEIKKVRKFTALTIDVNLLSQLATAISDAKRIVTLFIPHDRGVTQPVVAVGSSDDLPDGIGLIMPIDNPNRTDNLKRYEESLADIPVEPFKF